MITNSSTSSFNKCSSRRCSNGNRVFIAMGTPKSFIFVLYNHIVLMTRFNDSSDPFRMRWSNAGCRDLWASLNGTARFVNASTVPTLALMVCGPWALSGGFNPRTSKLIIIILFFRCSRKRWVMTTHQVFLHENVRSRVTARDHNQSKLISQELADIAKEVLRVTNPTKLKSMYY